MVLKVVRRLLGLILRFLSFVFPPKKEINRTKANLQKISPAIEGITLYQFPGCPFCIKVNRELTRIDLKLKTVDAAQNQHKSELVAGGGRVQVPCLRIVKSGGVKWLYESDEIIKYLRMKFV